METPTLIEVRRDKNRNYTSIQTMPAVLATTGGTPASGASECCLCLAHLFLRDEPPRPRIYPQILAVSGK